MMARRAEPSRWARAGERCGRFSRALAIVAGDGFATDARLGFNAAVGPSELEKGENLLLFGIFR